MINEIIKWTNENSGFLSIILFIGTIIYGWISGLFDSLVKRPKLKVRFIDKVAFYSFYITGEKHTVKNVTYDIHKTGFVVYMSIGNIGNIPTSIDKIFLGYYKHKKTFFFKEINWLPQWHALANFKLPTKTENFIVVSTLRIRDHELDNSNKSFLQVADTVVGVAYFEQVKAWGNFQPLREEDGSTKIKIKIRDIYGRNYVFKTKLKHISIEEAQRINPNFGNIEYLSGY